MTLVGTTVGWAPLPAYAHTTAVPLDEGEAADRVLAGALGWLDTHLGWFDPRCWEQYLPPRPFRPGPLLELLGLVRVLRRSGVREAGDPMTVRALDLAEQTVAETEFEAGLSRADELFPYHLNLIALLGALGRPRRELEAACRRLLAAGAGGHTRPYKPALGRVELRYFLDRGGFESEMPELAVLCRESIVALVRPSDVLHLTESETYALTHVLFYATDFGARSLVLDGVTGAGQETVLEGLRETVGVLLAVHIARGSLDLVAELLLCASALCGESAPDPLVRSGRPLPDPLIRRGWNLLARAARPDGAVPSPVHRPGILAGLKGDKAEAYLFGTCYHTTMAAALAAAAHQGSGPRPAPGSEPPGPAPPRPNPREPDLPEPGLPCADPELIRCWAETVAAAAAGAPTRLREAWSAHLDPLLVLCARAGDLPLLAGVLRAADRLGYADRPVPRSAAALLAAHPLGRVARQPS